MEQHGNVARDDVLNGSVVTLVRIAGTDLSNIAEVVDDAIAAAAALSFITWLMYTAEEESERRRVGYNAFARRSCLKHERRS